MTEHVVVEWGDHAGGGFALYTDSRRGTAPAPAFVRAAHDLQDDVVHQPPEDARDNDRFPVWGLQKVDVEDHGPHWCFTVQGRGGAFGRAGSCQFLFAPAAVDPAEVWAYGVALVGQDGRLGHEPRPVSLPEVEPSVLLGPLTALAERRRRVAVAGSPAEVAAVIGRLVTALPSAVVGEHIWMTFPLSTPVLDKRPSVTGQWPAEQSDNLSARRVARWLEPDRDELPESLPRRADEALGWLAQLAAAGRRTPAHRGSASMRALLDLIIAEELGITEADIAGLVHVHDPRLRNGTNPDMVVRWAAQQSGSAISELLRNPPQWLEELLFDGLMHAQLRAGHGQNPALFPPAHAVDGRWHTLLADLLRARYQGQEEIQRFVRDHVVAPGKPLGTPDLVQHWRSWLVNLGVAPNDPSIFPLPVKDIAAALIQNGRITDAHQQFLRAGDPVEAIRLVVGRMNEVTPTGANVLMAVPDNVESRIQVLKIVLAHNTFGESEPAAWLVKLITTAGSSRVKEAVVIAGTQHLEKTTSGPLPAAFLASVLEFWSELSEKEPVAHVVLRDAGVLLLPKPSTGSAPRPAPRHDDHWPVREEPARSLAFVPEAPQEDDPADEAQGSGWAMSAVMATTVVVVLFLVVSAVLGRLG
ncbi:hypothetical protein SAMN04488564_10870 [Lentzea waywayandensis]|uniref:Uncharacterized protein n=1 Tax=Lentzea waywayandensis TaxID=84724 RepID=A0A1I6F4W6_9PSEU|nr:hypothetical protein [Lentzea waywayandensis]SFR24787.1 hypothetical protein SAMN04488564_10870 [Lentzea waywayandensis]